MQRTDKGVIVYSGGMDSTVLLNYLVARGHEIKAISFDYGQRHKKELMFARHNCKQLGVEHKIINLHNILPLLTSSCLTNSWLKVPYGHYEDKSMRSTVVPNRNMMMLSMAIAWAENLKYQFVAIANHAGDHAIYPDCRVKFIDALNKASQFGTYNEISIYAPFKKKDKGEIAQLGADLGVDFSKTWSCYEGKYNPCGKCGTCVERQLALETVKYDKEA